MREDGERQSRYIHITRLVTGLILLSFAASHFLSHATGLFLLDGMERIGRGIVMAPWRTQIGRGVLLVALLTHLSLGLFALLRRRHLRIPPIQAVQLGLGLLIPILILPHAVNVRLGYSLFGLDDSYYRILYQYWISSPATGLPRQFALLVVLWLHGCIGVHLWLRYRRWYARWNKVLLAIAILIPVLAMLGIVNAGWDTTLRSLSEAGFAAQHGAPPAGTPAAAQRVQLNSLADNLIIAYVGVLLALVAGRGLRNWYSRRRAGITIRYAGLGTVTVPRGFSILEASLFNRIPHVSLCGGKARCSTCRVRILQGHDRLPPPNTIELATLRRIQAPEEVRLACQTKPVEDLALVPLVHASQMRSNPGLTFENGNELTVTALFIDLRDSTRLAAGRLPFDALFVINRFVETVSAVIVSHKGYVATVAGDGIMSMFGLDGHAAEGALQALAAAVGICTALERLNRELAHELLSPLRFGIGVHSGLAIVGALSGRSSLQFLGDTGNVASRLESLTKQHDCLMIISETVFAEAAVTPPASVRRETVAIRGYEGSGIAAVLIDSSDELASHIAALD